MPLQHDDCKKACMTCTSGSVLQTLKLKEHAVKFLRVMNLNRRNNGQVPQWAGANSTDMINTLVMMLQGMGIARQGTCCMNCPSQLSRRVPSWATETAGLPRRSPEAISVGHAAMA